jgi:peptide/nickel transport system substrate-binding protein
VPGGTITVHAPQRPGADVRGALTTRSLTQYARDPRTGAGILVPDLAVDLGVPSHHFTRWVFTIRDDAAWEDGAAVTPDEVARTLRRAGRRGIAPTGVADTSAVPTFLRADDVDVHAGGVRIRLARVVVDGQDVVVTLSAPAPDLDRWAAGVGVGSARSNGPYRVARRGERRLVLVRNEAWRPESDPGRHQYVDRWVFVSGETRRKVDRLMLADGPRSQSAVGTGLAPSQWQVANRTLGDRLVQVATPCTRMLAPDYRRISDKRVRMALAWAVGFGRRGVPTASGDLPGVTTVPANSVIAPGVAGKFEYFAAGEQFHRDSGRARHLLHQAGYGPGELELRMVYDASNAASVAAQTRLVSDLEAGGFAVRGGGFPVPGSPYRVYLNPHSRVDATLNLRQVDWCASWDSGSSVLPPLLASGAAFNVAHFSEPSVDRTIEEIASLPRREQDTAWGALDEQVGETFFPLIPTAFTNNLFVVGSRIGNAGGNEMTGGLDYQDLFVTPPR